VGNADLLTSGTVARVAFAYQQAQRAARQAERAAQQANPPSSAGSPPLMKDQSATPPALAPMRNPGPGVPQQICLSEAKARIDAALDAEIGFVERLVWFWSNHFYSSAPKVNLHHIFPPSAP